MEDTHGKSLCLLEWKKECQTPQMCADEKIQSIMAGTVPGQGSTNEKINGSEPFEDECQASVPCKKGMESRSAAIS